MAEASFTVPGMYADHHVPPVIQALKGLAGVDKVVASALRKMVTVTYDSGQVSADELAAALEAAGYKAEKAEGSVREEDLDIRRTSGQRGER